MPRSKMSLACSPSVPDNERLSEFVSLKYWNYNVVQYNEKVVDGFYDVYAITSHSVAQGEMPLLVDLQAVSISSNVEYEIVLVNRSIDAQLQQLENKVYAISVECKVLGHGMSLNDLIQSLANLVVDRMGGPVANAEEITKRWRVRSNQLKASLNTIVLPLGCLDVGLSRHRALLFKVLADKLNLPCMLVKGSLYTGTDEGAVNLIKYDDGSEYIIDLMGAPGALIPSEVPSSLLLDTALEARGLSDSTAAVNNLSLVFDKVVRSVETADCTCISLMFSCFNNSLTHSNIFGNKPLLVKKLFSLPQPILGAPRPHGNNEYAHVRAHKYRCSIGSEILKACKLGV